MSVALTPALRGQYQNLFATCSIKPTKLAEVDGIVSTIVTHKASYDAVSAKLGIPWYVVSVIHSLEGSLNFNTHLHNGDPLSAKTVHVPAGRPPGKPPFKWEASAIDALQFDHVDAWTDWSLAGTLFKVESFNGLGYLTAHPEVLSPYLWSYSQHYTKGKYTGDGKFDLNAVSQQCGAAVILRHMEDKGLIHVGSSTPISLIVNGHDLGATVMASLTNTAPARTVVAARLLLGRLHLNGAAIATQFQASPPQLIVTGAAGKQTINLEIVDNHGICGVRDLVTALDPKVQITPDLAARRISIQSSVLSVV